MTWNPVIYNQFKSERAAPFFDLLSLVQPVENMKVIDLGCGTGELTLHIADKLQDADITGIDSSAEMLSVRANPGNSRFTFTVRTIEEQLTMPEKWDLIFSNAAMQWVDDHETLFPKLVRSLNAGGQLAIQMPAQHHNQTNILLNELAEEEPFKEGLKNFKRNSSVLDIDRYAAVLFDNGAGTITAFEKIYPLIVPDVEALFTWVSGTALVPYMEKLDEEQGKEFILAYKTKLAAHFKNRPLFYPFKRILLHAVFK